MDIPTLPEFSKTSEGLQFLTLEKTDGFLGAVPFVSTGAGSLVSTGGVTLVGESTVGSAAGVVI